MDASPERDWADALERAHAKTMSAYISLRQHAVNDDSQRLRDVVTTLRLLVGAVQSLALLVEELRMRDLDFLFDGPKPGRNLIDTLDGTLSDLSQAPPGKEIDGKILVKLRAVMSGLRTAAATDHHFDFELCLSTTGSSSVADQRPQPKLPTYSSGCQDDESYDDALACVEQICGPDIQLAKPGDYYVYKSKLAERDVERPSYGTYALRLPELVEKHWGSIRRDDIMTPAMAQYAFQSDFKHLFSPKLKSGNFENWVLEYARQQWPGRYDPTGPNFSTKPLVRLMSDVSDPSLRPIHVAAALGMPEVCEWLVSADPKSVRMRGPWGTPYYCALLGPNAFLGRMADPVELLADMRASVNQPGTLLILQNAGGIVNGADASIIGPSQDEPVSLSTLAFLVCNFLRSPEIFLHILDEKSDISFFDSRFLALFRSNRSERSTLRAWPISFPPISLDFLRSVLPAILDRAVVNYDSYNDMSMLATGVYEVMGLFDLEPEHLQRVSPLLDNTPNAYTALVREAVQDREVDVVRRLIEDPRWDPNAFIHKEKPFMQSPDIPSPFPEKGTSILHWAVESDDLALTNLLLKSGSDVHVRNHRNQTPLLLSESPDILKLLVSHGAITTDTDEDGRNIWHVAAANSDIDLIDCLLENDENQDVNLRARMRGGQTPIAQGIIYPFKQMIKGPKSSSKPPFGALHLLKWCKKDAAYLRSPKPLLCVAAEWSSEPLASSLLEFGANPNAVDDHGRSVLHHLNVSATPELVRTLKKSCKAPILDHSGLSPAETIFAAFNRELGVRPSKRPRNHPAYSEALKASAYECLLTRDVLASRNASGAGLWERFLTTVIAQWSPDWPNAPDIGPSVLTALNALVKAGALADYETSTQTSALFPILASWIEGLPSHSEVPPWLGKVFDCIFMASCFRDSLKSSSEAITLLKACIQGGRGDLVQKLLKAGISVHEKVGGTSALEVACQGRGTGSLCSLEMFKDVLYYADAKRLNEVGDGGTSLLEWLLDDLVDSRDDKLMSLLSEGCDPTVTGANGTPVVLKYILHNQVNGTLKLLAVGADPSATDGNGRDSALTAVSVGCLRIPEILYRLYYQDVYWERTCTFKYEVNSVGYKRTIISKSFNALHIASISGHDAIVQFYIEQVRLSVNVATVHERWTPLHCAALGGSKDCIRVLVEHGADPTREDHQGRTPLMIAVEANDAESVRLLLKLCSARMSIEKPFLRALELNYGVLIVLFAPFLTTLLPRLPPTSEEDQASRGHLAGAILEALITEGDNRAWKTCERVMEYLDPAALNDIRLSCGECSPAVFALRSGRYKTCLRLLQLGMRPDVITGQCPRHFHAPPSQYETFHPCTILHLAVRRMAEMKSATRHIHNLIQFLLDHTDWHQHSISPIHCAVTCKTEGAGSALLAVLAHLRMHFSKYKDALADRQLRGVESTDPDYVTHVWTHKVLSHFINQRISSDQFSPEFREGDSPLLLAAKAKGMESMRMIKILAIYGANVSDGNMNATTPLHEAARNNFVEAVEYLLQFKANHSLRDANGSTPLMVAIAEGNLDAAKVLVSHGASVNVRSWLGTGLLSICAKSKNPAAFLWLLGFGLDPYELDEQRLTPLHRAIINPHLSSLVLNRDFDLSIIAQGNSKYFLNELFKKANASQSLTKVLKRLPTVERWDLINISPGGVLTPLCGAVAANNLSCARVLWDYDAEIDEDGASEGSALMMACSFGRMDFVKMFVPLGARISYIALLSDGQFVFRNALAYAGPFPEIVRWILVERHTSQRRLAGVDPEAMDVDQDMKPWSGGCVAGYDVSGTGIIAARTARESSLDYVKRLEGIRRGLRGTVVRVVELKT